MFASEMEIFEKMNHISFLKQLYILQTSIITPLSPHFPLPLQRTNGLQFLSESSAVSSSHKRFLPHLYSFHPCQMSVHRVKGNHQWPAIFGRWRDLGFVCWARVQLFGGRGVDLEVWV
ncbi:hypothetical protein FGO68_gene7097 [Halteria grandinella]|uniref:Uncharacterized protein n=1 Tax=Halteria grandinella TaxID=5974 RepID=A0A8J8P2S5_HALGN|nr:hypothetical protein FGO68_gene7097 [Halteria grandinella]